MILPLVLVGMLLMLTFSASVQQAGWRAMRGARTAWDTQLGFYLADAAVAEALGQWSPDSVAAAPIGTPLVYDATTSRGWRTRRSIVRTAPLTAVVQAVTQRSWSTSLNPTEIPLGALGDASRIRRNVTRIIWLEPPPVPILAAATILGHATVQSAFDDGRDLQQLYDPLLNDCGPLRDTASVAAIAAEQLKVNGAPVFYGGTVVLAANVLAPAQSRFDPAFSLVRLRANAITPTAFGTVPTISAWRASVMQSAGTVTLEGSSRHIGLLAIDGDLTIHGALRVDGVLLVRGALDASTGTLDVHGALIVRDASGTGSTMGPSVGVTYVPCLVGRALAAVAIPRASPFDAWNSP